MIYQIKPDKSGNFSIDLPKGTYRIWVNITLQDENVSTVASIPYLYIYPTKGDPIIVNLMDETYITIEPKVCRWYPPEPVKLNRFRIVGHIYNPEHANLTVKLYMTDKPIYCLEAKVEDGRFEFKDVLPAKNYTIEVVPNEITLSNGSKIIYKKVYVSPEHATKVEIPYEVVESKRVPSFEVVTALLSIFIALHKTNPKLSLRSHRSDRV